MRSYLLLPLLCFGCKKTDPQPTAPPTETPQEIVTEDPPLVAYATPDPQLARVVRRGNQVTLRLRWSAVEGADRYQVQISRVITFTRPVVDVFAPKRRFVQKKMEPGVYFWRVRATGVAGEGGYCGVQVLDATISGQRGKRREVALEIDDPEPPPIEPDAQTTAALRVVWRKPRHRAIVTTSPVSAEGVSTRGTLIQVAGGAPHRVESSFSIPMELSHGRNDVTLTARLGEQQKRITRVLYYADPARLAPIRQRFEELRTQLKEIAAIREELSDTLKSLQTRLEKTENTALVAELEAEMNRINEIRTEIDEEINRALGDLDELLGS